MSWKPQNTGKVIPLLSMGSKESVSDAEMEIKWRNPIAD